RLSVHFALSSFPTRRSSDLSWMVDSAQRAIGGSREYFQVMEQEVEPTVNQALVDATQAVHEPQLDTTQVQPLELPVDAAEPIFAFDDVTFAYEQDKPVIQSVSFAARKGEKVALVGESGGGKSTLVNLLLGLYQPSHGSLKVLGHNAGNLTTARLRASVGVVFQEAFLFSGTISENIAYGKPNATQEEIIEVA